VIYGSQDILLQKITSGLASRILVNVELKHEDSARVQQYLLFIFPHERLIMLAAYSDQADRSGRAV
jgi:hypothetical protein